MALIALGLVFMLLWATSAGAQAPTTEDVYRIADKLNCPLCQGVPLSDCPLVVCDQMRALIREKLANGETEEQIIQYFVDQYGVQVLNAPPARGFNLLVWILPFVGLIVGASLVTYTVRGWLRTQEPSPSLSLPPFPPTLGLHSGQALEGQGSGGMAGGEPLPPEYLERLEKELEESA